MGIYANDGLWDEDESEVSTARYSSAASHAASSIKTKGGGSMKSRSRSGTASPFPQDDEKVGMWGWTKRGRDSPVQTINTGSPDVPKGLKKKESKIKLKGKGRRGELLVSVDPEEVCLID